MDIDLLKKQILKKLDNENLDFTLDEEQIIKTNGDLFLELINIVIKLSQNDEYDKIKKIIKEYGYIDTENFGLEISSKIRNIITENIIIFDKDAINCGQIDFDYTNEELVNFFEKKLKDPNYKITIANVNDTLINKLLDSKRYDIISSLSLKKIKEKSTITRLIEEFPFDKYDIYLDEISLENQYLNEIIKQNLDKMSIGFLIRQINKTNIKEYKQILLKKLEKNNINMEVYETIYNMENFNKEEKEEIIKKAIKTKQISILLLSDLEYSEKTIDEICKIIMDDYEITNKEIYNEKLLKEEKFIKTLIKKGYINLAYKSPLFEKNKHIINELINNEGKKYLKKIKIENTEIPEILIELIKNEQYEQVIKYIKNKEKTNTVKLDNSIYITAIEKISKTEIEDLKTNEFFINSSIKIINDEKLIKKIPDLETFKKIITLVYLNNSISDEIFLKYQEQIGKIVQKSYYLNNKILLDKIKIIIKNKSIRPYFMKMNTETILNYLKHHEDLTYLYDEDLFNEVKRYYIKKYKLDPGHLETIKTIFGPLITKYIENDNIQGIINLDNDKFNKFINLFLDKKEGHIVRHNQFEMSDLEIFYDSFKQEQFIKNNPDIKNIFTIIKNSLKQNNKEYKKYIRELLSTWDKSLESKIIKKYPNEKINRETYLDYLCEKIISNENQIKYLDILHIITDHYIKIKREEYRKTYNMIEELNIPYTYDEKDVTKEIIKLLLKFDNKFKEKVINNLKNEGINETLAKEIIEFYITKDNTKYKNRNDVKKNVITLLNVAQPLLTKEDIKNYTALAVNQAQNLKKKYYAHKTNIDIYKIFSNIRISILEKYLLNNDEKYDTLKNIMDKYRLDVMPEEIETLLKKEEYELDCELEDITVFITYFYKIYDIEQKKLQALGKDTDKITITIMNIFKYIEAYSSNSSVYSQILGSEDARLIRQDPTPNSSSGMTKEERLKKAVEKTFKNFEKNAIKIPSFIKDIKTKNNRTLTAIVGNYTKTTNITHGERTESCMRIAGAGYSLFDSDEIFHIEFDDELTGKYISRVTGFRNGNTVFLNELRNSCDEDLYTNLDIAIACIDIANELIERSKNSSCPIENVVIHRRHAIMALPKDIVKLNVTNIKKGLPYFYTDIDSHVQVLATTGKNGKFTNVSLDNKNVPNYLPARERIQNGNNKLIIEQINRIHTINLVYQGKDYRYIEPYVTEIKYGIVGEDFYVFIDKNDKIFGERIVRDERSEKEYNEALEKINDYLKTNQKQIV